MMILQYSVFILIIYIIFLIGSIIMIPFAYIKALSFKFQVIFNAKSNKEYMIRTGQCLFFLIMGLPFLTINLFTDFYYFWANNFRSNLKKIIIEKNKSELTNESVRDVTMMCQKYSK